MNEDPKGRVGISRREFISRTRAIALPLGWALSSGHDRGELWPEQGYGDNLAAQLQSKGLSPLRWDQLDLNSSASRISASVMKQKGLEHPQVGFQWNSDDSATAAWYPQGIADLPGGGAEQYVVVSWYNAGARGVRVSLADIRDIDHVRYQHVLLVQSDPAGATRRAFAPIPIHAGGLATQQGILFVADGGMGVRVFDMNVLFRAEADPSHKLCGLLGGKAYAFDYRYILPQIGAYALNGPPRFSFASVDWTDSATPQLVMGNYHSHNPKYFNPPPTLAWWNLSGSAVSSRTRRITHAYKRVQGAVSFGDHVWLSCSGSSARLRVIKPAQGTAEVASYSWPHGCEDLHHSPSSDKLWCLTEHPGQRMVFAVRRIDYVPA